MVWCGDRGDRMGLWGLCEVMTANDCQQNESMMMGGGEAENGLILWMGT